MQQAQQKQTDCLTPIDQQERKTYDFDGDETKTGSARLVVYVGAMWRH